MKINRKNILDNGTRLDLSPYLGYLIEDEINEIKERTIKSIEGVKNDESFSEEEKKVRIEGVKTWEKDELDKIDTDIYIYINKLSYKTKKKIELYSANTVNPKQQTEIFRIMKEKGWGQEALKDDKKLLEIISEIDSAELEDSTPQKAERLHENSYSIEKSTMEEGINQLKHNFRDEDDKLIKLDFSFWEFLDNRELNNFIIKSIQELSKGLSLGKKTKKA